MCVPGWTVGTSDLPVATPMIFSDSAILLTMKKQILFFCIGASTCTE